MLALALALGGRTTLLAPTIAVIGRKEAPYNARIYSGWPPASCFMGLEALPVKSPATPPQAGSKPGREQDAERREEEIWNEPGEADGPGVSPQNQTGGFTPFQTTAVSARACV